MKKILIFFTMIVILSVSALAGRIFYEPFDGNTSIQNNLGTVYGEVDFDRHSCGNYADMTKGHISYPLQGNFNPESMTLMFWFKDYAGPNEGLFDIGRLVGGHPNSMGIFGTAGTVWLEIRDSQDVMHQIHMDKRSSAYRWQHVAITLKKESADCIKMNLFLDGEDSGYGGATVCGFHPDMQKDMLIGDNNYYGPFRGHMDEFEIYDSVLTNNKIHQEYLKMKDCTKSDIPLPECIMPKGESSGNVKLNCSGFYIGSKKFHPDGVVYSSFPINTSPDINNGSEKLYSDQEIRFRDIPILRSLGINSIRTHNEITDVSFLDQLYNEGNDPIYVLMGIPADCDHFYFEEEEFYNEYTEKIRRVVSKYKDHPAILGWILIPPDISSSFCNMYGGYNLLNEMAKVAYEVEGEDYHPIGIWCNDLSDIGYPNNTDDRGLDYIDFWGMSTFPGTDFKEFFDWYELATGKPLILADYGADSIRYISSIDIENIEDTQASTVKKQYEIISSKDTVKGQFLREYSDGWWYHYTNFSYNGLVGLDEQTTRPYWDIWEEYQPFGDLQLEAMGMFSIQDNGNKQDILKPKKLYYTMKEIWSKDKNFTLQLKKGWNLISVPLILGSSDTEKIMEQEIYGYEKKWTKPSSVDPCKAYWTYSNSSKNISLSGRLIDFPDCGYSKGINLMGYPYLDSFDSELVIPPAFAFDNVWSSTKGSKLYPGSGYAISLD